MVLVSYEVHQSIADDSNEGWILIRPSPDDKELREALKPGRRPIVCIKGVDFKPVYAEALNADDTYLKKRGIKFNKDMPIFISAWYRNLFGIEEKHIGKTIKLDVKLLGPRNLWALLYLYPRHHPQAMVRAASMMGIIGFGLGVIGIGLGFLSIDLLVMHILGFVFCGIGFVITLLGIRGLIRS